MGISQATNDSTANPNSYSERGISEGTIALKDLVIQADFNDFVERRGGCFAWLEQQPGASWLGVIKKEDKDVFIAHCTHQGVSDDDCAAYVNGDGSKSFFVAF